MIRSGLSLVASLLLLVSCTDSGPLRIGFNGELSGHNATLSVQGRNGAQLAVDDVNRRGGVSGRPLELVVRDNQASPNLAAAIDQEFVDSGIFLLTGHLTSWESESAMPLIESRDVILFSPTTSSPAFSGKRDHFFRLIASNDSQVGPLAEYAFQGLGLRRVAIIDDEDNESFTHPLVEAFTQSFTEMGGKEITHLHFSSKTRPNFHPMIKKLRQNEPDMLLIVASAVDTALIAQHARMAGWQAPVFTSNWAYTSDLIKFGGSATEGITFVSSFDGDCQNAPYLQFQQAYQETYGHPPTFAAAMAYETIQIAAAALEKTGGRWEGLGQALTETRDFPGLCSRISIDEYGDVQRSQYLFTIQNGAFKAIEALSVN